VVFASDLNGAQFIPGRTLTLTAKFSDGTTASAVTTLPGLSVSYSGKVRDRVGQGNVARSADGALDGVLTAHLFGGGRTITSLKLQSTAFGGSWDTAAATADWLLGVASTLDGALRNNSTTMAVNFAVLDGGSFVVFASDLNGAQFIPGRTLTLTAKFSDGTTASAEVVLQ
jgi:hypothetical protein